LASEGSCRVQSPAFGERSLIETAPVHQPRRGPFRFSAPHSLAVDLSCRCESGGRGRARPADRMILSAGSDPLAYLGSGEIKAIIWATGYRPDYSVLDRKGRIQHDGGVLDALLTDRSVSKAAERVHISQSAMSDALARLREYFQTKCLFRWDDQWSQRLWLIRSNSRCATSCCRLNLWLRPTFCSIKLSPQDRHSRFRLRCGRTLK
jgi:hypothetical protein